MKLASVIFLTITRYKFTSWIEIEDSARPETIQRTSDTYKNRSMIALVFSLIAVINESGLKKKTKASKLLHLFQ